MSGEKFCLKWNDFEKNISCAFKDLRRDKQLFDVTLACGDDFIQAHKVILSACSTFFRNILARSSLHHTNLLLYLKGIRSQDMESVLEFMYQGEVSVSQDDLNMFLQVAEDLQVKGLTQNNTESGSYNQVKSQPQTQRRITSRPPSTVASSSSRLDDDIQEVTPAVKTETSVADAAGDDVVYDESGGGVMTEYDESYAEYDDAGYGEYDPVMAGNYQASAFSRNSCQYSESSVPDCRKV